jgi:hypothetical protein
VSSGTAASAATSASPLGTLTFAEDPEGAQAATIPAGTGGVITATGADGTTFTLTVPANALDADTQITVVPLTNVAGIPSDQPISAAMLKPDGLQFITPATLEITPADAIPQDHQVMFQASQSGTEITLATVDPASKVMIMDVPHFSVGGAASVTDAVFREFALEAVDDAFGRAQHIFNATLGEARRKALLGVEDPGGVDTEAEAAWNDAVDALAAAVAQAGGDCAATEHLSRQILGMERQRQLLGLEDDPALSELMSQLGANLETAFSSCQDRAITECKKKPDPGVLLQFWFGFLRQRALLGVETTELPDGGEPTEERAQQLCSPSYAISGTLGSTPETSFTGCMSKPSEPFTVTGSGGNIVTLEFSPSSDTAGRWSWDGQVGNAPMDEQGKGTYTISLADDGSGGTLSGNGTVVTDRIIDKYSAPTSFTLTLTPTKGC